MADGGLLYERAAPVPPVGLIDELGIKAIPARG
jgi:hypothetical protein